MYCLSMVCISHPRCSHQLHLWASPISELSSPGVLDVLYLELGYPLRQAGSIYDTLPLPKTDQDLKDLIRLMQTLNVGRFRKLEAWNNVAIVEAIGK